MDEVLDFLKANHVYFIATVDGDQPHVRPFGSLNEFEGKLFIATSNTKAVYQQIIANPKVEMSSMSQNGQWLRLAAKAIPDERPEVKEDFFESAPQLKQIYKDNMDTFTVLCLTEVTASIITTGGETKTFTF